MLDGPLLWWTPKAVGLLGRRPSQSQSRIGTPHGEDHPPPDYRPGRA
jgi:hypothetical protein